MRQREGLTDRFEVPGKDRAGEPEVVTGLFECHRPVQVLLVLALRFRNQSRITRSPGICQSSTSGQCLHLVPLDDRCHQHVAGGLPLTLLHVGKEELFQCGRVTPHLLLHDGGDFRLQPVKQFRILQRTDRLQCIRHMDDQGVAQLLRSTFATACASCGLVRLENRVQHPLDRVEPVNIRTLLDGLPADERLHVRDQLPGLVQFIAGAGLEDVRERRLLHHLTQVGRLPRLRGGVLGVLVQLDHVQRVDVPGHREEHGTGERLGCRILQRFQCTAQRGQVDGQLGAVLELYSDRAIGKHRRAGRHCLPVIGVNRVHLQCQGSTEPNRVDRGQGVPETGQLRVGLALVMQTDQHLVERAHRLFPRVRAYRIPEQPCIVDRLLQVHEQVVVRGVRLLAAHLTPRILGVDPLGYQQPDLLFLVCQQIHHVLQGHLVAGDDVPALIERVRPAVHDRLEVGQCLAQLHVGRSGLVHVAGREFELLHGIHERGQFRPSEQPHRLVVDRLVQLVQ